MLDSIRSTRFSIKADTGRQIPCHWVVKPNDKRDFFTDRAGLSELRESIAPAFRAAAGIADLNRSGFRLTVDLPCPEQTEIHLVAGQAAPCLNPQDWRTIKSTTWDPQAPLSFHEAWIEAAGRRQEALAPGGRRLFYAEGEYDFFGLQDGDPKSETHFIMLSAKPFINLFDGGVTSEHWARYFGSAGQILQRLGLAGQPARLTANSGFAYQALARLHLHVQTAARPLPKLFPQDYGFLVDAEGVIEAPAGSGPHARIIGLIDQRKAVAGNDPKAPAKRQALDQQIFSALENIG
ncbi:MAG: hypothetical protein JW873_06340 [Candidatus Saganbacteria bacterium]|nr:hypothetical protein [Candidatus Saganbacteria bacterium]